MLVVLLEVAFDFEEGGNDNYLDIPAFKIADAPVPKKYEKAVEKVNGRGLISLMEMLHLTYLMILL